MKKIFFSLIAVVVFSCTANAEIIIKKPVKKSESSFAIVVDKTTFEKTETAIIEYRNLIEKDNLSAFIIVVEEETPEAIRTSLKELYEDDYKLEGAVFIGDIPVPMIRDAQHLTSAFKLAQDKGSLFDTSVPSDRYYEDFDLIFNFVQQDTSKEKELFYYYSLDAASPQKIDKDIYSARIKPPFNDSTKYELINKYLQRINKAKETKEALNNMFVFTGHGYNSESLTTWVDRLTSLHEQYPQMLTPGNKLKYLHYDMSRKLKRILMKELEKEELDVAVFHAHGYPDTQYLLEYPGAQSINDNVEGIKRFIRSKLRTAKRRKQDVAEYEKYYMDEYNVPRSWFENAFDDSLVTADSLYDYEMDLYSDDLALFSPQAKFIMFDECYNGAFNEENYIAGRYLFGSGNVITACANSVNVLQDKWADEFMGLLNMGVSIGKWHKNVSYLENHIFGDPTFSFANNSGVDINLHYYSIEDNIDKLKEELKNENPEVRVIVINRLTKLLGADFEQELLNIYKTDVSYNARLEAISCLASLNTIGLQEILKESITDPFEMIRRVSATLMGNIGREDYIPFLIRALYEDEGNRVSFNARNSLAFMNQKTVSEEIKKYYDALPYFSQDKESLKHLLNISTRDEGSANELVEKMNDAELKESKRISAIRTLRNYNYKSALLEVEKFIHDESQPVVLRRTAVEALGWFCFSIKRNEIINELDKLIASSDDKSSPLVLEALKSKNRLKTGCNVSITP